MFLSFWKTVALLGGLLIQSVAAQQYAGDIINNTLPYVPGAELAYFKIKEPLGKTPKAYNLTLANYQTLQLDGKQMVPSQVERVVIIIHGLNRDPGTYISNIQSAFAQLPGTDPNINRSSVLMMAPYFPNGNDKNYGYPYNETNPAIPGKVYSGSARSYSGALVWTSSQWAAGGANQYPAAYQTVSSYHVIDQLLQWFGNKAVFPNLKEIVLAGHSLGAQTVQRYAIMGQTPAQLGITVPVVHWIGNPNSYAWLNSSRPLPTISCPAYDQWRDGLQNFTGYTSPAVYNADLTKSGMAAIKANYMSKNKAYARGLLDNGDDSSTCAPSTTGANRNERFFKFIDWFPATCEAPTTAGGHCDTIDFMNIGHDAGSMMASPAGQARLFVDNFYGNGARSYDFGYPRQQAGDDPFPNPDLVTNTTTAPTIYAGNMTLQGCYSDSATSHALQILAYDNSSNTIDMCTSTCNSLGYAVAGVESGTQCYCGPAMGATATLVIDSSCSTTCPGNSTEVCGGPQRINIYSNGAPAQLAPPGNPDGIYNGNYNYLNCYSEATNGRALSATSYTDTVNMTLESCAAFCSGYKYFGIEYSQECYCGSCLNGGSAVIDKSKCSQTCTGSLSQYCGAGNALSVYQLDDASTLTPISQSCDGSTTTTGTTNVIPSTSQCPAVNGMNVTDTNNVTYVVTCSSDSSQGSYLSATATNSYLDCMTACDAANSTGCTGFTYVGGANGNGAGSCYLKTNVGTYSSASSNLIAAVRFRSSSGSVVSTTVSTSAVSTSSVTSSGVSTSTSAIATSVANLCPSANNQNITDSNNNVYLVTCSSDSSVGSYASTSAFDSYLDCMVSCDAASGCNGFTYVGGTNGAGSGICYLKSSMGSLTASGANLISAAKVGQSSSSSSSSLSGQSSSSSTSAPLTSTVSSSTSTSAVATSVANMCPSANNQNVTDLNNNVYLVSCSSDNSMGSYASTSASNSYLECMLACDAANSTGCTGFTYVGATNGAGSGICYLKSLMGTYTATGDNLISAAKVGKVASEKLSSTEVTASSTSVAGSSTSVTGSSTSSVGSSSSSVLSGSSTSVESSSSVVTVSSSSSSAPATTSVVSCPGSNATTYTSTNGAQFLIECGIDHSAGDLSSLSVKDFASCIDACATTAGCVDVSLSGVACYLKSSVGASTNSPNVWGAKLVASTQQVSTMLGEKLVVSTQQASTTSSQASFSSSSILQTSSSFAVSTSSAALMSSALSLSSSVSSSLSSVTQSSSTVTSSDSSTQSTSSPSTQASSPVQSSISSSFSDSSTAPTSAASSSQTASSTIESSVSSTSTSQTTSATTCPGMDQSSIVDAQGQTYTIYCSADMNNAVLSVITTRTGILGCMALCDNKSGCTAFTYAGDSTMTTGYCYLRTAGGRNSGGANTAVAVLVTQSSGVSSSSSASSSISASSSPSPYSSSSASSSSSIQASSGSSTVSTSSSTVTLSSSTSTSSIYSSSSSLTSSSSLSSNSPTSTSSAVSTSSTVSTTKTTSSSSTASVTPTAPLFIQNYQHLGCYNDTNSARTLKSRQLHGNTATQNMTMEICASYCASYEFWGVEYGQECYCGNTISSGSVNQTLATGCKMACPGNSTELCGGGGYMNLYSKIHSSSTSSDVATATGSVRRRGMQGMRQS